MAKYKSTGCLKFLIFLLIAVPAAFAISSYYHGENPLEYVQNKIGGDKTVTSTPSTSSNNNEDVIELNTEINELRNEVRKLEDENQNLRNLIKEKDLEINDLLKSN